MTRSLSTLAGKVVVVTGGGTGIGAAVARRYASEGAAVVVVGRREGPLTEVAGELGALAIVADVAQADEARRVISATLAKFGRVDVLVANAGGHGTDSVADTTDDAWAASLRSNLTTAFVIARAAVAALSESAGQIVLISSIAGISAGTRVAGYTVGKHAIIGLTRSLARDLARSGVRANAVCPGWVRTPMADDEMDVLAEASGLSDRSQAYELVTADIPLGRAADPSEIASVVRFLGSEESSFMTGSVVVVDGGGHIVDVGTLAFSRSDD